MATRRQSPWGFLRKQLSHSMLGALATMALSAAPARAAQAPTASPVRALPLVEVPATAGLDVLVIHLSGDGGLDATDKGLAQGLASQGIPVVTLNCRKYFGSERAPEAAAEDLAQVIRHYLDTWSVHRFVLSGYSFGADVMPYLVNRLPQDLRSRLQCVALLAPTAEARFHVTLTERFGLSKSTRYPVAPEIQQLRGTRVLCFYGERDGETIGSHLDPSIVAGYPIPGGHLIGKRTQLVVDKIVEAIRQTSVSLAPARPSITGSRSTVASNVTLTALVSDAARSLLIMLPPARLDVEMEAIAGRPGATS